MEDATPKKSEEEDNKAAEEEAVAEEKKEPEPDFEVKKNPSRVLLKQENCVKFEISNRFQPVVTNRFNGFIVLEDTFPDHDEDYWDDEEIDPDAPNPGKDDSLEYPEDFEFDPDEQKAN